MWPGFGENSRVLSWMFDRCNGKDNYVETAIGLLPKPGAIEPPPGVSAETITELTGVDTAGWKEEISSIRDEHYAKFGDRLPKELYDELDKIEKALA